MTVSDTNVDAAGHAVGDAPSAQDSSSSQTHTDAAIPATERIAFLSLAAALAKGRRVLVVDDGASSLSGIAAHLDSVTLAEAPGMTGAGYEMLVADLADTGGAAADAVSAFAGMLDAEAGFALVRLPNSPHFRQLHEQLKAAFAQTSELRQHNWVASAVLTDAQFSAGDPSRAAATTLRKAAAAAPGEELYTIVLAGNGALPRVRPHVALTRSRTLRELTDELERVREAARLAAAEAAAAAAAQHDVIRELQEQIAWLDEWELNLRERIEQRPWALSLVKAWARFVVLARRAKNVLRR